MTLLSFRNGVAFIRKPFYCYIVKVCHVKLENDTHEACKKQRFPPEKHIQLAVESVNSYVFELNGLQLAEIHIMQSLIQKKTRKKTNSTGLQQDFGIITSLYKKIQIKLQELGGKSYYQIVER